MSEKKLRDSGLPELTGSTLTYGAVPLIVVLSGGSASPLLFAAIYVGFGAIPIAAYMFFKRPHFYQSSNFKQFLQTFTNRNEFDNKPSILNILRERSILVPVNAFGPLLIAWAFLYIPDVIAAVVLETWPIFFIFVIRRGEKAYYFSTRVALLFALNFFAVALVVLSDSQDSAGVDSSVIEYLFGLLLIAFSMLFYLQSANRIRQGERLSESIFGSTLAGGGGGVLPSDLEKADVVMFLRFFALTITSVVCIFAYFIFEIFGKFEDFSGNLNFAGIIIAALGGVLVNAFGAALFSRGTIKGTDLRVQAVGYFTPIVGIAYLIFLSLFLQQVIGDTELVKGIEDINWPWFSIGFMGVLAITVITNFKSEEHRFGLTSLVVALWITGALVFFRDDWVWWEKSVEVSFKNNLEYFGFIGVSTTIFALLLGFQAVRNEERARREDQLVFSLLNQLQEHFPSGNPLRYEVLKNLADLDSARYSYRIESPYREIASRLSISRIGINQTQTSNDTMATLNELAHSKQYGSRVSESIPIVLLGLFSIFLAVAFRPPAIGYVHSISLDIFAFLFAAVITYLIFHLFDLYFDRRSSSFYYDSPVGDYRVGFQPSGSKQESVLASILITLIVGLYLFLYFVKWVA